MNNILGFLILISCNFTYAGAESRSRYNLLNPTPEAEMRELNTDRPDKTESPYTVDAGHFQIETDVGSLTLDNDKKTKSRTSILKVNNMTLKVGLSDLSDFQLILPTYIEERVDSSGKKMAKKGVGDSEIRYKHNVFGNNGGEVAVGLMPYVKLPTAGAGITNGRVEGGLLIPMTIVLPDDWKMGLMVELEHLRNSTESAWQTDYALSASLNHSIIQKLYGFVEIYSRASDNQKQGSVMSLDFGFTYLATKKVQLDAGVFLGLTGEEDDVETFAGISVLF